MAKRSKLPSGNIDGWKFNWLTHPAAARGFGRPLPPDQAKHWVPPHKHTKDRYTKYGELVYPESKGSGGW